LETLDARKQASIYFFIFSAISLILFLVISSNYENLIETYYKLFPSEEYWKNKVSHLEQTIEDEKRALRTIPYSIRKLKRAAHAAVGAELPEDVSKIFEEIEMMQANEFVLVMEIEDIEKELKYARKKLADCQKKSD